MPVPEPTVPVIVYLHADRMIPKHSHLSDGTYVPCSAHVVETQALATLLFATALWSLREQAVIKLEISSAPDGGPAHLHEDVKLSRLRRVPRPGLEGAIADTLEGDELLRDVICRWSAARSTDPWHDGVHEVAAEAAAGGYLREVKPTGGVLARLFSPGPALEPDCVRIRALEGRYEGFERAWERFRAGERAFHDVLIEQCRRALVAATECWYP